MQYFIFNYSTPHSLYERVNKKKLLTDRTKFYDYELFILIMIMNYKLQLGLGALGLGTWDVKEFMRSGAKY
jgi:hypothetical protein